VVGEQECDKPHCRRAEYGAMLLREAHSSITAVNRGVINPTAEELSMGPLLREAHSSVAHKKLPKRRLDAIGAIGGHCWLG
jgi:hypothetical protein